MAFPASRSLDSLLHIVLVDGGDFTLLRNAQISESISWEDFAQALYNMTITLASSIIRIVASKPAGEGLGIDDGDWYYKLVVPTNTPTTFELFATSQLDQYYPATLTSKGEWKPITGETELRRMMNDIYYGNGMEDTFIEVQHQLQRETVEVEQQIDEAAEEDITADTEAQVRAKAKEQAERRIQAELRGYFDQMAGRSARAFPPPSNTYAAERVLKPPVRLLACCPQTEAEIEADQASAMAAVAGLSCARDLPAAVGARLEQPRVARAESKERKVKEEVEEVKEEDREKNTKEQVDARAARAARRSSAK